MEDYKEVKDDDEKIEKFSPYKTVWIVPHITPTIAEKPTEFHQNSAEFQIMDIFLANFSIFLF
jgi:hypothetical protein